MNYVSPDNPNINMSETIIPFQEEDKIVFSYRFRDVDAFDEGSEFKSYHHYEEYDPNKTYQSTVHEHDYGHGKHIYLYEIYLIGLMKDEELLSQKKYIIAVQQDNLSNTYSVVDANTFDEKDTFKEYHHYEEYDPGKLYQDTVHEHDYGHGIHKYIYESYTIGLKKDGEVTEKRKYIIAVEQLSEDEIKQLSEYCQCQICIAKWYDISSYFRCRCCYGCLKSNPQQYQINRAREYMSRIPK